VTLREVAAVARLDLGEVLRSRWLLLCLAVYAALGIAFVWVGLRESGVLGFTGMGRVLFSLCHALVLVLPLLALLATGQVINRSREDGSLELFLAQPISRSAWLVGVALVRSLALALPLVAVLLALALAGGVSGHGTPVAFLGRAVAVSVALLLAFTGVALWVSVSVRSAARATTLLLLLWAGAVFLLDAAGIALLLRWQLPPRLVFALAAANPVQAARLALLAAAEPELATLGPVGFYLATRIGPGGLLALGTLWPALAGALGFAAALRGFRRGDLV
jgi:ABC-type transport system involved in multi-copper enzyme maturation permease subunit